MTPIRRWLILIHRYLGIPLSALFVLWFASGIVMMYSGGMPSLTPELRVERRAAIDPTRIRLTPAEAAGRADLTVSPARASLRMVVGRPAYQFERTTVFADNGDVFEGVGRDGASRVVGQFTSRPETTIRYVETLDAPDQWTLAEWPGGPVYKFRVGDDAGSELYVSANTAEVTVLTTRRSRALAWIGAIPHWLYFAELRRHHALWNGVVVWASTLGCLVAVIGLVLGVTQFRWRRSGEADGTAGVATRIPYTGWMRWHYLAGAVFGVFTLTWVFSGLLSMEPYAWTRASGLELPRDVMTGGRLDLTRFPVINPTAWTRLTGGRAVKEVNLLRIQDGPYFEMTMSAARSPVADRVLVAADTLMPRTEPFTVESVMSRLTAAVPGVPAAESVLLTEYDSYYYSRGRERPLPVLRVKFDDPADTWFYVDPRTSRLLAGMPRLHRLERWLFNGLHSLDFAFWYDRRPLWDVGVIALSLGGLASTGIGLWVGLGRVRRALDRKLGN